MIDEPRTPGIQNTVIDDDYYGRDTDYLGIIGEQLGNLTGYATLANELLQNADDAKATGVTFDVRSDSLVVENDAAFSDCKSPGLPACPWLSPSSFGYSCDFHSIRQVGARQKRLREGTTGAFGIGFIAVYQVTDRPELLSAGRHWVIREEEEVPSKRIKSEPWPVGLPTNATQFRLPWARDSDSPLRRQLVAPAFDPSEGPAVLLGEFLKAIPQALLFLRTVTSISVKDKGQQVLNIRKEREPTSYGWRVTLDADAGTTSWLVIAGEFNDEATRLRGKFGDLIEKKRGSHIQVACSADSPVTGLLFASLPTQDASGLPFHLQADFFPSTDRKKVILESSAMQDHKSEWNRAAIAACARAFAKHVESLAHDLGPVGFWETLPIVMATATDARQGRRDPVFAEFMDRLGPSMATARVAYTNRGEWTLPRDAPILETSDEIPAIPVLDGLGLPTMNEDLRRFVHQGFAQSPVIGTRLADLTDLVRVLRASGLTKATAISDLSYPIDSESARETLWNWVALRMARRSGADKDVRASLADCAIVPTHSRTLGKASATFAVPDMRTVQVFGALVNGPDFADIEALGGFDSPIVGICRTFGPRDAIGLISDVPGDEVEKSSSTPQIDSTAVLEWFASADRDGFLEGLHADVAGLSIFPTSAGLRPLADTSLPGDFADPIGLAEILDIAGIEHLRPFLERLGATPLSLEAYLTQHLPRALREEQLDDELRRAVVALMAEHLPTLKARDGLREVLQQLPVVECGERSFRPAIEVYFRSSQVGKVLGLDHPFAVLPLDGAEAVADLLRWMGVADRARLEDVESKLRRVAGRSVTKPNVKQVSAIVEDLTDRSAEPGVGVLVGRLRGFAWLPAEDDLEHWYFPNEIYMVFRRYLFESQARFLALPYEVQSRGSTFFENLGVPREPTTQQVVDHLLYSSGNDVTVHREVFGFLSDHADDGPIDELIGERCLLLTSGYEYPNRVFWLNHPFGKYRRRLSDGMQQLEPLLRRLGVRSEAGPSDAVAVLLEIAQGATSSPVDDETRAIVGACWRMLSTSLVSDADSIDIGSLVGQRVILDSIGVLARPETQYFEDRPGLAKKFGDELRRNVISREAGTWFGMMSAGVSGLATVSHGEVVDCSDPVPNAAVPDTLRERWLQVLRCVDPDGERAEPPEDVTYLRATALTVRYVARIGGKQYFGSSESPPAFFDAATRTLYYVPTTFGISWAAVSREIALVLFPTDDPSSVAAGLRIVLAAATRAEAERELDELGYPPLGDAIQEREASLTPEGLGGETYDGPPPPHDTGDSPEIDDEDPVDLVDNQEADGATGRYADNGSGTSPEAGAPTGHEPDGRGTDGRGTDGTRQDDDHEEEPGGANWPGHGDRGTAPGPKKKGRIYNLRTFVSEGSPDNDSNGSDEQDERSQVDVAGIKAVIDSERLQGRMAVEMPHTNPGYDVESSDDRGDVRYIEVKSLSGIWVDGPVALSSRQYETGRERGDDFWLYVVEKAESLRPEIHRVRNPVRRVTDYVYDNGWAHVAALDAEREEQSKEQAE